MPEVYKKFRDSQGLASISRALKASQAAKEAEPPEKEKEKTSTAEARKATRRQNKDLQEAGGLDTGVQSSSPALKQKRERKRRESEGGQPDRGAEASEGADTPRKKRRKAEASGGSTAVRNVESGPSAPSHELAGGGLISSSEAADAPRTRRRRAEASAGDAAGTYAEDPPSALALGQAGGNPASTELPEEHEGGQGPPAQTFRDFYVKTFSSAFASELFDLRQAEGEKLSLDLLLRHMESGVNIFSATERELLQQGRPIGCMVSMVSQACVEFH